MSPGAALAPPRQELPEKCGPEGLPLLVVEGDPFDQAGEVIAFECSGLSTGARRGRALQNPIERVELQRLVAGVNDVLGGRLRA